MCKNRHVSNDINLLGVKYRLTLKKDTPLCKKTLCVYIMYLIIIFFIADKKEIKSLVT